MDTVGFRSLVRNTRPERERPFACTSVREMKDDLSRLSELAVAIKERRRNGAAVPNAGCI